METTKESFRSHLREGIHFRLPWQRVEGPRKHREPIAITEDAFGYLYKAPIFQLPGCRRY